MHSWKKEYSGDGLESNLFLERGLEGCRIQESWRQGEFQSLEIIEICLCDGVLSVCIGGFSTILITYKMMVSIKKRTETLLQWNQGRVKIEFHIRFKLQCRVARECSDGRIFNVKLNKRKIKNKFPWGIFCYYAFAREVSCSPSFLKELSYEWAAEHSQFRVRVKVYTKWKIAFYENLKNYFSLNL